MLTYERGLWEQGVQRIAGVDEVGRGCLFGDVVAAAVVLPTELEIEGVNDSKKLSEKKREALYEIICAQALGIGIGRVEASVVDEINVKQAARLAMKLALAQLSAQVQPDYLLVDAERVDSPIPQQPIIHGDALSQSIAAASIVAKVTRDRLCLRWDMDYPAYGIASHKGYATKTHREAIMQFGPCPLHRKTFLSGILNEQLEMF